MLRSCLFLCIFIFIRSEAGLAPFIKPCVWNDKKCILESSKIALPYFIKGLPDLDISSVETVYIKEINANNGDLKLNFKDLKITGVSNAKFINLERPDADKTVVLEVEFPVHVTGKYKAEGKLFVLAVNGEGDTEISSGKINLKVNIRVNKIEKGGKKYYKISGFDYTFDPIERVTYKFTNLYDGDEQKAKLLMDLINQNWKDLLFAMGKPIIEEIVHQQVSKMKKFFLSVPANELELL